MEKSQTISELAKALVTFQLKSKTLGFDAKNPFFKSSYTTLTALVKETKAELANAGLVVSQLLEDEGALTTILIHSSGEFISSKVHLKPTKDDPQGRGSCITYSRRYAYAAILGLVSDADDDAEMATDRSTVSQPSAKSSHPEGIQYVAPPFKLSKELQELEDLGKKAFKGSQLNFLAWMGTNFQTNDMTKLSKEQVSKAKNYLTDAIVAQE